MRAISIVLASLIVSFHVALPVQGEPMSFHLASSGGNCGGCEWIAAQGEITPETPTKFKKYIAENGKPYLIRLHSNGGSLIAGIELGRMIREQGATTTIGKTAQETGAGLEHLEIAENGICASACAFAFMGGLERHAGPNQLGMHQFYSVNDKKLDSRTVQILAGVSLLHTIQMGIDPRVIVAASSTGPEAIRWFSQDELTRFGLDTSYESTEPWKLEPYLKGQILTTIHHENKRRSVAVTLFCRVEDRKWRMLISEKDPGYKNQITGGRLLRFSGPYPVRPVISLGQDQFTVGAKDVEFERFVDGQVFVSVHLPSNIETSGGLKLSFEPDLARVFNSFIRISVVLPKSNWLKAAKRNCI